MLNAEKKVCLLCFEPKSYPLRDISENPTFVEHLKLIIGANFDVQNQRQPLGLCDSCRKKFFSTAAMEAKVRFVLPPYLYTIILSNNDVNLPCECGICD